MHLRLPSLVALGGLALAAAGVIAPRALALPPLPSMHWADTTRGRPFAKDPSVIWFKDRYLLYYSVPPWQKPQRPGDGWRIGLATSPDLTEWKKIAELGPEQPCEAKGVCAPGAIVLGGRVHLFYQTYGNGPKDAICHAWSDDGVAFTRDPSNPVFAPTGAWTAGRAIDAEAFPVGDRLLLFFATRDPAMKIQMLGVAGAPLASDFSRRTWQQLVDGPVLQPELPWERACIEAPTIVRRGDDLVMFYAGGYNNEPQQIGAATSRDGLTWTRLSAEPFLAHGGPDSWNASESGHPGVFVDPAGRTHLFYQGNRDRGATWYLSRVEIGWKENRPVVLAPR